MQRVAFVTMLFLFSSLAGYVQPVEALTGNEVIQASNVLTDEANITASNLDSADQYKWTLFIYYPTGSMCASDTGYMTQNVQATMTDSAHWGPCIQAGNYTFSLRLYKYSNSQILDYHNGTYYSPGTNNSTTQDSYEPNDGQSAAVQINTFTNYTNLTVHSYSDEDWFWFNVTGNQNIWVNLTHNHAEMDAILWAYRDTGGGFKSTLDYSDTEVDWEQATFNSSTTATNTWTILIRVLATGGASGYNMSIEHANRSTPAKNIADSYEPNEAINQSHSISLPFNSQSATIHNSTDEDFYSFYANSGDAYWLNLTFIDSGGDLELFLYDNSGTELDSSETSTSNEQISWSATTNGTYHIRVDGYNGNTNTYRLEVATNSSTPQPILVNGDLVVGNNNATTGWSYIYNTTANASYSVDWSLSRWNGGNLLTVDNGSYSWNATYAGAVNNQTINHPRNWISESWCLVATLEGTINSTTLQLDTSIDCWTPTFIDTDFPNDWKANVNLSDLEPNSNVHYSWSIRNSNGGNIHDSGNNSISTSAAGNAFTTASWNYLSQGSNCLWADIWAANGTLLEHKVDCYTPTLPAVNFTTFNNTSIGIISSQLLNNGPWRVHVEIEDFNGLVLQYTTNRTWTGSSDHWENWTWTPQNTSGWYCAVAYLHSQNGSLWDVDETCIQLAFDDDGDGVLNEDDWCNNTLPGYAVDLNGCADYQKDSDSDGYTDDVDAFPWDHTEWNDTDNDGYGDNTDEFPNDNSEWEDSDGDGVGDNGDAFPNDQYEWADSDGDGCGDNSDAFPNDSSECLDTDGDGVGDNADAFPSDGNETSDSDGDGCGDNSDAFPNDNSECLDTDGDGVGDNADAFPSDISEWADSDGDGVGDNADVFPSDINEWLDSDSDGVGDNGDQCPNTGVGEIVDLQGCDDTQRDTDMDGIKDAFDTCPATPQGENPDSSGCSASQRDTDNDTITDDRDQCPTTPPESIVDGVGCSDDERDSDNDGIMDSSDSCPNTQENEQIVDSNGCAPSQKDTDSDSITDNFDLCPGTIDVTSIDLNGCSDSQRDSDGDGVKDSDDLCPSTQDEASVNLDGCAANERDSDDDGHLDSLDQCPNTPAGVFVDFNGCATTQKDTDSDGVNDADDKCTYTSAGENVDANGCAESQRDSDLDGVNDMLDDFPYDSKYSSDKDGDGVADELDAYPLDASRSMLEVESSNTVIVILMLVLIAVIGGVGLMLYQNQNKQNIPEKSSTNIGPSEWVDANGVNWSRSEDGSVHYWDDESQNWVNSK